MHELSIASNIVEIIGQYVPNGERTRVRSVITAVGEQSGIIADSLDFSYQAITASTDLERSHLQIEMIPFMIRCSDCGNTSHGETGSVHCPNCGSCATAVVSGTELNVREIEIEDETLERP